MSEFTAEIYALVKRYYLEVYGLDLDVTEFPWHEIVGFWWTSQAHYRLGNFYFSLEEVESPVEGKSVSIVLDLSTMHRYVFKNGEWVNDGELTIHLYK